MCLLHASEKCTAYFVNVGRAVIVVATFRNVHVFVRNLEEGRGCDLINLVNGVHSRERSFLGDNIQTPKISWQFFRSHRAYTLNSALSVPLKGRNLFSTEGRWILRLWAGRACSLHSFLKQACTTREGEGMDREGKIVLSVFWSSHEEKLPLQYASLHLLCSSCDM